MMLALINYPVYGISGQLLHPYLQGVSFIFIYFMMFGWTLIGSENIAEICYRSCRFGSILSLLLPVVTGVVSFLWTVEAAVRPPTVLPGYSALEIPVIATALALGFIAIFLFGSYLSARNMDGIPF